MNALVEYGAKKSDDDGDDGDTHSREMVVEDTSAPAGPAPGFPDIAELKLDIVIRNQVHCHLFNYCGIVCVYCLYVFACVRAYIIYMCVCMCYCVGFLVDT